MLRRKALTASSRAATADRLARRTAALHAAKTNGADATRTLVGLAAHAAPPEPVVADLGCGRGTTALALADRLAPAQLLAIDQSAALLATVTTRARRTRGDVRAVRADFHQLPLAPAAVDVAVAAFCLYHSPDPRAALTEIACCLVPTGAPIAATKGANSYRELDQLVADTGLDPAATLRPSLYQTFHAANAPGITAQVLDLLDVVTQEHAFRFTGHDHLAAYLATTPKYHLPAHVMRVAESPTRRRAGRSPRSEHGRRWRGRSGAAWRRQRRAPPSPTTSSSAWSPSRPLRSSSACVPSRAWLHLISRNVARGRQRRGRGDQRLPAVAVISGSPVVVDGAPPRRAGRHRRRLGDEHLPVLLTGTVGPGSCSPLAFGHRVQPRSGGG